MLASGTSLQYTCRTGVRCRSQRDGSFGRDLSDPKERLQQLRRQSYEVVRRLQRSELVAGTVAIKLRYTVFTTLTRQMRLAVSTDDKEIVPEAALVLFRRVWQRGRPVRLLGVVGRRLSRPARQLPLL
jgi:DNA polymerase-4